MGFIVTLIIVGTLLILAEIFLLPGVGMTGVIGFLCLAVSCACAFDTLGTIPGLIVTAISSLLFIALIVYVLKVKSWRRFMFHKVPGVADADDEDSIEIGDKGLTLTRLSPAGSAKFGNTVYDVIALEGKIAPDQEVEVVLIENNKIIVRPSGSRF